MEEPTNLNPSLNEECRAETVSSLCSRRRQRRDVYVNGVYNTIAERDKLPCDSILAMPLGQNALDTE